MKKHGVSKNCKFVLAILLIMIFEILMCYNYSFAAITGDINNDGDCTSDDIIILKNHLIQKETLTGNQISIADINNDGKISLSDLSLIKAIVKESGLEEDKPGGNTNENQKPGGSTEDGKTDGENGNEDENKKLVSIEIASLPKKTTYIKGESFDASGLSIMAVYADGTREDVTGSAELSPFDANKVGVQTIRVSFEGKGESFKVYVSTTPSVAVRDIVKGVEVVSKPIKTIYKYGENLDLTGLSIGKKWVSGNVEYIYEYNVVGYNPYEVGKQKLSVVYFGADENGSSKTYVVNFTVEVIDYLTGITVIPNKSVYKYGEDLDFTITGQFVSGAEEYFNDKVVITGYDNAVLGEQIVTIKYTERLKNEETKVFSGDIGVEVINFVTTMNITLNKSVYKYAENLDFVAEVVYANNEKEDITTNENLAIEYDSTILGDQTVKFIYTENLEKIQETNEFTYESQIKVIDYITGIEIETLPSKVEYLYEEKLDTTGLSVKATYASGATTIFTEGLDVSNYDAKVIGTQTLTVTYTEKLSDIKEENKFTTTYDVTVIMPVSGVSLNKETTNIILGQTETLIATITPENATNKTVGWSSSDNNIITVDDTGKVTAVNGGTATITVTTQDGNFTDTCEVTVIVPVTGISLNKTTTSINVNETETLVATITPENATNKNITWTSSDETVAKVDNTGLVTMLKDGTATITVKTEDGDFTASCEITGIIPITNITLDKENVTLNTGKDNQVQLTATIEPENATNKLTTWTTSNAAVATIGENGLVTAVSEGKTTITVHAGDNKTDSCEIIVEPGTLNILYIGNSKTYYNNMPTMFEELANKAYSDSIISKNVNVVQYSFDADAGETNYTGYATNGLGLWEMCITRTQTLCERIASQKWDYIILQDKTNVASNSDNLETYIKGVGAITIYAKAGRTELINTYTSQIQPVSAEPTLADLANYIPENNNTNPNVKIIIDSLQNQADTLGSDIQTSTNLNAEAVRESLIRNSVISEENIKISYTGDAFELYYSGLETTDLADLYYNDETTQVHPSVKGSYLRACTNYITIFGSDGTPVEALGHIDGATASTDGVGPTSYAANANHDGLGWDDALNLQGFAYEVQGDKPSFTDGSFHK